MNNLCGKGRVGVSPAILLPVFFDNMVIWLGWLVEGIGAVLRYVFGCSG
jgi:hypothetical protein